MDQMRVIAQAPMDKKWVAMGRPLGTFRTRGHLASG
jgi:hypothetical protein